MNFTNIFFRLFWLNLNRLASLPLFELILLSDSYRYYFNYFDYESYCIIFFVSLKIRHIVLKV